MGRRAALQCRSTFQAPRRAEQKQPLNSQRIGRTVPWMVLPLSKMVQHGTPPLAVRSGPGAYRPKHPVAQHRGDGDQKDLFAGFKKAANRLQTYSSGLVHILYWKRVPVANFNKRCNDTRHRFRSVCVYSESRPASPLCGRSGATRCLQLTRFPRHWGNCAPAPYSPKLD